MKIRILMAAVLMVLALAAAVSSRSVKKPSSCSEDELNCCMYPDLCTYWETCSSSCRCIPIPEAKD
jgi:hypothetical protein